MDSPRFETPDSGVPPPAAMTAAREAKGVKLDATLTVTVPVDTVVVLAVTVVVLTDVVTVVYVVIVSVTEVNVSVI